MKLYHNSIPTNSFIPPKKEAYNSKEIKEEKRSEEEQDAPKEGEDNDER